MGFFNSIPSKAISSLIEGRGNEFLEIKSSDITTAIPGGVVRKYDAGDS